MREVGAAFRLTVTERYGALYGAEGAPYGVEALVKEG